MEGRVVRSPRPSSWATAMGLVALAVLTAIGVAKEEPVGAIEGVVFCADDGSRAPRAVVVLSSTSRTLHARTDTSGHFRLGHVPADAYGLSVTTDAYEGMAGPVHITEGKTTHATLRLQRSLPNLALRTMSHTWLPTERGMVQASGYLPPPDQQTRSIEIHVRPLDTDRLLRSSRGVMDLHDALAGDASTVARLSRAALHPVRTITLPLPTTSWEGYYDRTVKLDPLPPGVYLLTARCGTYAAAAVVHVTDLAILAKADRKQIVVLCTDVATGKQRPGTMVRLADMRQGPRSDEAGVARLASTSRDGAQPIVARHGTSVAFTTLHVWDDTTGMVIGAYTERPVYRPGQRVYFKGIVRRRQGSSYTVPAPTRVTVRAEDPEGVVLARLTCRTNDFGAFSGSFDLTNETPTGAGTIFLSAGDATAIVDVNIASYAKPQVQLTVKPIRNTVIVGETVEFDVTAAYYYGAPLPAAEVSYTVSVSPAWDWHLEPDAEDELSDSAWMRRYDTLTDQTLREGTVRTSSDGRAKITVPLHVPSRPDAPQALRIRLYASTTDPAYGYAEDEATVTAYRGSLRLHVNPGSYLIRQGVATPVSAEVTDLAGQRVSGSPVRFELFQDTRKDGSVIQARLVATAEGTSDRHGIASSRIIAPEGGEYRLVAKAMDTGGRTVFDHCYLWSSGPGELRPEDTGMRLDLYPDKRRYREGDTAHVLLRSSCIGARALVTVEAPDIQQYFTIPIRHSSTVLAIPVRRLPGRRMELAVGLIQRKRLLSASVVLSVEAPRRTLSIRVIPDTPVHRPGDTVRLRVEARDSNGRPAPAEASLALVDESIYAVMEDQPRLLERTFYPRLWSSVATACSCEETLLDAEGAGAKGLNAAAIRRRFADTAVWIPHIRTDKNGQAQVVARLPDNITRWRVTVRAHTRETYLGYGRGSVTATLPFHVRLDAPRFLTAGDTTRVTAVLRNGTASVLSGRATLLLAGGLRNEEPATKSFILAPSSSGTITWSLSARDAGPSQIRVVAATDRPTMTDGMLTRLMVRPCARERTWTVAGVLEGDVVHRIALSQDASVYPGSVTVRLTPSVLASVGPGLDYLVRYPYGCTEQTVSSFLPDILVARLLRNLDPSTAAELRSTLSRQHLQELPAMVRAGISRLNHMANRGWGWWGSDTADPWLTAYATMALGQATRDGYSVPQHLIEQAAEACKALSTKARPDTAAFLSYALALVGGRRLPTLPLKKMGPTGLAFTLLECRVRQDGGPTAKNAYDRLAAKMIRSGTVAYWTTSSRDVESDVLCTALGLQALLQYAPSSPDIERCLRYLMMARTDDCWTSTRDTAFVLTALVDYVRAVPLAVRVPRAVDVVINGKLAHRFDLTAARRNPTALVARLQTTSLLAGQNRLELRVIGRGTPFYSLAVKTYLAKDMAGSTSGTSHVRVIRTYEVIEDGAHVSSRTGPAAGTLRGPVKAGTPIRVKLTIHAKDKLRFVLITDPYPAGFEPIVSSEDPSWTGTWFSAMDLRDDHAAIFAHEVPRGKFVVEYYVRAGRLGRYTALPTRVENMYDPSEWTEGAAASVEVR